MNGWGCVPIKLYSQEDSRAFNPWLYTVNFLISGMTFIKITVVPLPTLHRQSPLAWQQPAHPTEFSLGPRRRVHLILDFTDVAVTERKDIVQCHLVLRFTSVHPPAVTAEQVPAV